MVMIGRFLGVAMMTAATAIAGAGSARAQDAPADVNVVNVVDAVTPSDSAPVIASQESVQLDHYLFTDVVFPNLEPSFDSRLIVDFVSVEAVVGPDERAWATFIPCKEKGNLGRTAVPLSFGGNVFLSGENVNDSYLGTVAMQSLVEKGCTAVVRVFRSPHAGLGHAHVTIQGHRAKKSFPIIIPR